ncbi:hypothetical protein [Streptomyces sp. NPDC057494]|uniref:hypothetical protein n=1 Tax=Streptomyces sp. NPDC057494 TaxID=3346148 RepID=UPI0036918743
MPLGASSSELLTIQQSHGEVALLRAVAATPPVRSGDSSGARHWSVSRVAGHLAAPPCSQALGALPGVAVLDRGEVEDLQAGVQQSNAKVN